MGLGSRLVINNIQENNPRIIADEFNRFFNNVGPQLATNIQPPQKKTIHSLRPAHKQHFKISQSQK